MLDTQFSRPGNVVRVFLSSTFRDFGRERELVHLEVVPIIEEMCDHFGLSFELSDLRWGVTSRDVNQNRTVEICLREVDACRTLSPELNFLVLLGDRSGSRFIPDQVPAESFGALLSELEDRGEEGAGLAARLRMIYPPDSVTPHGALLRHHLPEEQSANSFLDHDTIASQLAGWRCTATEAEEVRRSLAYSLTHREVLRSGALDTKNPNQGAFAIVRTCKAPGELQAAFRLAVQRAISDRSVQIDAKGWEPGRTEHPYEPEFVKQCTRLLGTAVQSSRHRGTRRHFFQKMLDTGEKKADTHGSRPHQQELNRLAA